MTTTTAPDTESWLTPEPLDNFERPPFPLAALPIVLVEYVHHLSIETGTPHDLAGMLVLSAVAIVCAKRFYVSKPWPEPVNLWTVVAMAPGERKSPVYTRIFNAIAEIERRHVESTADERHAIRAERAAAIAMARSRMAKAKKDGKIEEYKRAHIELQEAEAMPNPAEPRLLAGDVTPEAIVKVLAENDGRIGITNDEGGIFATLAGRYSAGIANLDAMMQSHDGGTIRVDRVGRPSQFVDKPALTLGLTVQPEILHQIGSNHEFKGRGLLARVLWSVPDSKIGWRPVDAATMPRDVVQDYENLLKRLDELEGMSLHLDEPAEAEFREFRAEIEARCRPSGDLAGMAAWVNKHPGSLLRIAALLHIVKHGSESAISLETLTEALEFSPYLIAHARIAMDALGMNETHSVAQRVLDWAKAEGQLIFTQRDACHDLRIKADELVPGLDVLVENGWLRREKIKSDDEKGRGRPSIRFSVWPGLFVQVQEEAA